MKKSLTTISYNEKAKVDIRDQLTAIIGNKVKIRSLCYKELKEHNKVCDDLILITAPVITELVKPYIDENCSLLIALRTLDPRNLNQLLDIPDNSEVLVVNNLYDNAREVIQELQTIGITNLKLYPYNPSKALPCSFQYAITPGEIELVPPGIPYVINLGTRLISIMTIAEILYHFNGSATCDNLVSTRYIKDMVRLSMQLSRQAQENKLLRQQLEIVISNFEDGIIVTDLEQKITFFNRTAKDIFNRGDLVGDKLQDILPLQVVAASDNTFFTQIDERSIHISYKTIELESSNVIEMAILKDLTRIRTIDEQYRKQRKYLEHNAKYTFTDILYKSSIMDQLVKKAKHLALSDSTILITGESGTGKELLAQSLHNASARREYPFVALNCAALSEALLESELFGYEEGAFTGARKGGKMGLFEQAHRGTIFLDEIGDAPLTIQIKLLRVLQEKEIMRIGDNKIIPVDVRVISATNKDLNRLVAERSFREDLFYRLSILPLHIPPLRERKEDIEILARYFLTVYARMQKKKSPVLTTELLNLILAHNWPGNIRELENACEYMVTISNVSPSLKEDLADLLGQGSTRENMGEKSDPTSDFYTTSPLIREEALVILEILAEAREQYTILGRTGIQQRLGEKSIVLSEQQVKSRLQYLQRNKLVSSTTGKGTIITEAGLVYLKKASGGAAS